MYCGIEGVRTAAAAHRHQSTTEEQPAFAATVAAEKGAMNPALRELVKDMARIAVERYRRQRQEQRTQKQDVTPKPAERVEPQRQQG